MTQTSTLRELLSRPREVHAVAYGLLSGFVARKVLGEIRHEPQYFVTALAIGVAIAEKLRGDT